MHKVHARSLQLGWWVECPGRGQGFVRALSATPGVANLRIGVSQDRGCHDPGRLWYFEVPMASMVACSPQ